MIAACVNCGKSHALFFFEKRNSKNDLGSYEGIGIKSDRNRVALPLGDEASLFINFKMNHGFHS